MSLKSSCVNAGLFVSEMRALGESPQSVSPSLKALGGTCRSVAGWDGTLEAALQGFIFPVLCFPFSHSLLSGTWSRAALLHQTLCHDVLLHLEPTAVESVHHGLNL